jgi:hypothetical protein
MSFFISYTHDTTSHSPDLTAHMPAPKLSGAGQSQGGEVPAQASMMAAVTIETLTIRRGGIATSSGS